MKQPKSTDLILKNAKKLHMIGIGGSGMCPLVEILHTRGYHIEGSDNNPSDIVEKVRSLGIKVTIGHNEDNLNNPDVVIYSAAINSENPELKKAREMGIPCLERSLVLGAVSRDFNNVIGVSGTHGKTTVTSMITQILMTADLDPSAVIGGKLPLINTYGRAGKSDTFVCEACEFVDTFLQISPDITVILNIDEDHLDYFKTVENLMASFRKFAESSSRTIIANGDDERTMIAIKGLDKEIITFGFDCKNDYYAENVELCDDGAYKYSLMHNGEKITDIRLSSPGKHNVLNSVAAAAAAILSGADAAAVAKGLYDFRGAGRRFEIVYTDDKGITVADDYAHHPAELEATLKTAKSIAKYKRVIAVFQPFTFSRTAMLLEDFATALAIADKSVITAIMGSREVNTYGIKATDLSEKIENASQFDTFDEVAEYTASIAQEGDLIITLGCGDVYKAGRKIIELLKNK